MDSIVEYSPNNQVDKMQALAPLGEKNCHYLSAISVGEVQVKRINAAFEAADTLLFKLEERVNTKTYESIGGTMPFLIKLKTKLSDMKENLNLSVCSASVSGKSAKSTIDKVLNTVLLISWDLFILENHENAIDLIKLSKMYTSCEIDGDELMRSIAEYCREVRYSKFDIDRLYLLLSCYALK